MRLMPAITWGKLRPRAAVAFLAAGVLLSGMHSAVPMYAQAPSSVDDRQVDDPCAEAEVPPPPPEYPPDWQAGDEAEVPPPPPEYPPDWQAGDEAEVPPPCDLSFRVVEIPGGRSWSGACIDSLARGPIVLKWTDPSGSGVFTLRPISETHGSLIEVLTSKGPGYSYKYQGKGRYRIEVVQQTAAGSPQFLDVVYATKGTMKQCAGGSCISSKLKGDEALIPLESHQGACQTAH